MASGEDGQGPPHGVCIDSQGWIRAVCFQPAEDGKYYALRIDPTQGVGSVVEAVDLGAFPTFDGEYHGPYNYSDMTGFVTLGTTQPAGVWDFVQDSGASNTLWSSVTLGGDLNSGNIIIEARAADGVGPNDSPTDLPSWPFRRLAASTGTIPFGTPALKGRYLETRVTLLRNFGATQSPVVRSLSLAWGAPGSDLQITGHPKSQIVALGSSASATFSVSATGSGLSYEWFRDGVSVGSGASLTVSNPQYADAGKYHVRVTDGTGTLLDSAEARLHVNSTPSSDNLHPDPQVDHSSPARGQSFNVNAAINISPSPGPDVYYQWRKNGVPIPSKSGKCTFNNSDQTYSAGTYTVTSAQCPDTGSYSVAFTNQYWKIVSTDAPITVYDQGNPLPLVTLAVSPPYPPEDLPYVWITDPGNPPTLTATACFSALCAQWYTSACGTKIPIPEATGFSYKFPNPVTLDFLGSGCFEVEVFDEGGIPHEAIFYAYASW